MIELKHVQLDNEYCKKWNITLSDFVNLYKDGIKVNDTLYRVSGIGVDLKDDYFMLLKHEEAFYDDNIITDIKRKRHLESKFVIINKDCIEKVCFKSFDNPYLCGGLIYTIDHKYYNIETGEFYCHTYSHYFSSNDFIFLDNKFDKNLNLRGIMKINKHDGSYEVFK
jgi:hypothetical protein